MNKAYLVHINNGYVRNGDIYHWRMNGSYSLKSVLPVLVPEMTYDGMEISDGAMDL